jgi:hypothetical protein
MNKIPGVLILEFDTCETCGCKLRIAEEEGKKEKEAKRLADDVIVPLFTSSVGLANPNDNRVILTRRPMTVLTSFFDACKECGTVYVTKVYRQEVMMEPQVKSAQNK